MSITLGVGAPSDVWIGVGTPPAVNIGVGTTGPPGPPGAPGPEGGTPVVAIPYAEWPPANPEPDTLYLRLAP